MLASERRISFILIGISVSFFIFTLPVFIMENINDSYFDNPNMEIALACSYMLMYLNHVINFFFYCSLGPNFRKEVKKILPKFLFKNNRISPLKISRCNTAHLASSAKINNKYTLANRRELISYLNLNNNLNNHSKFNHLMKDRFEKQNNNHITNASHNLTNTKNYTHDLEMKKDSSQYSMFYTNNTTTTNLLVYNQSSCANNLNSLNSNSNNNNKTKQIEY